MGSSGVAGPNELESLDFVPPRDHVEVDVEAIAASVSRSATNKRLFLELAATRVADRLARDEVFARAHVDPTPGEPYDDLPWHDYLRVMVTVAEELRGPDQLGEGFREIGRCFYRGMDRTPVGRMLLGTHLGDVIRQLAENWQQLNTVGRVRSEFRFERNIRFHFDGYSPEMVETVAVGIFEGLFRHHFMPETITLARVGPMSTILDVRW